MSVLSLVAQFVGGIFVAGVLAAYFAPVIGIAAAFGLAVVGLVALYMPQFFSGGL